MIFCMELNKEKDIYIQITMTHKPTLQDCTTLVQKHVISLRYSWFPQPKDVMDAIINEDIGWYIFLLGINLNNYNEDIIKTLFIKNFKDIVNYHRRTCGCPSFKGVPLLGPNCSIEHGCGLPTDTNMELTDGEASALKIALDKMHDDTLWTDLYTPYSGETLYKLVTN